MKPACGFEDFPMLFEPDPGTQAKVAIPREDVSRSGTCSEKFCAGVLRNSFTDHKYPPQGRVSLEFGSTAAELLRAQACPEPVVLPSVSQTLGL